MYSSLFMLIVVILVFMYIKFAVNYGISNSTSSLKGGTKVLVEMIDNLLFKTGVSGYSNSQKLPVMNMTLYQIDKKGETYLYAVSNNLYSSRMYTVAQIEKIEVTAKINHIHNKIIILPYANAISSNSDVYRKMIEYGIKTMEARQFLENLNNGKKVFIQKNKDYESAIDDEMSDYEEENPSSFDPIQNGNKTTSLFSIFNKKIDRL